MLEACQFVGCRNLARYFTMLSRPVRSFDKIYIFMHVICLLSGGSPIDHAQTLYQYAECQDISGERIPGRAD